MSLSRPVGGPDAILERLAALHPQRIDLSLDRVHRLLAALDHPELRLPPVIHVAGTNGKGSTIAFLRAALEAAGKRVHVYTSPHLVRFNERIRLAGALVEDAALSQALDQVEAANAGAPITLFEITTAAAFVLFAQVPADVLLLEVGLGGRLDATNVVDAPLASVITPLSIDHVDFLGPTLELIAAEKAGIIKRRVPVIVAAQPEEALEVIERAAARKLAPVLARGQQWTMHEEAGRLVYSDEAGLLDLPRPRLMGAHQIDNAGLAVATLRALPQLGVSAAAIEAGLRAAEWPARLQRLAPGPLTARAPADVEVWLDGGHNAFLAPFAGLAREVIAVPVPGEHKGLSPEEVAAAAAVLGMSGSVARDVGAALDGLAAFPLVPPPRVLIAGSLYLAGAVLQENGAALL
ncbi:MAG: bifunctional folylpolyglutamate synthase/dihydrofolate synthase [Rhizobiales bacterium 32-66-11]|nr:MAG: bifunctional folylpolyglutamate synthase/dihydrofolate synthase [Rhizobiales bacterium 32-66-11]